jgi:hypothetical protein
VNKPSVEALVRAVIYDYPLWPPKTKRHEKVLQRLEPFARTCGTCDGKGNVGHTSVHPTHGLRTHEPIPCPNPDCINGKEYVSVAREIDRAWASEQTW